MQHELNLRVSAMRRDWIDEVYPVACLMAHSMKEFSSDCLHIAIANEPPHQNWYGSLCARMKADGVIQEIGRVKSTRRSANGRKVTLWRAVP